MDKSRRALLDKWLSDELHLGQYHITLASSDASFRTYYRLSQGTLSYIVMDAPPQQEDCTTFIDISNRLLTTGLNVPEVIEAKIKDGFLLLTDLGSYTYLKTLNEVTDKKLLYTDAVTALVKMQHKTPTQQLPYFTKELLIDEMTLFFDWLVDIQLNVPNMRLPWRDTLYKLLINNALEQPKVFVHRDYHSRNLMYYAEHNPAILDFQDAVIGPLVYDIVSLLKDCYIEITLELRKELFKEYILALNEFSGLNAISEEQMQRWFDLTGVQRHMKACGIFARLYYRDKKADYLKEIPRTLSHILALRENYLELKDLCQFIENILLPRFEI